LSIASVVNQIYRYAQIENELDWDRKHNKILLILIFINFLILLCIYQTSGL